MSHALKALLLIPLLASVGLAGEGSRDASAAAGVMARFAESAPDWQVWVRSLVDAARLGPDAAPVLTESLASGSAAQREFAALALAMFDDEATREALLAAALDPQQAKGVRIDAVRALSITGAEIPEPQRQQLDGSFGSTARRYQAAVLARDQPLPEVRGLRDALRGYDLARLDSAHIGYVAPEFVLSGVDGQSYRLSQFRGETVVLEFNGGFS